MRWLALIIAVLPLVGCASASLPYKPEIQPKGVKISAGYQILADRLRVEIDTDHRRLEDIFITRADGTAVRAQQIDNAPTVVGPPPSVSVGVGGGSWGGGGGIGVGTGIGIPVGAGSPRIEGPTFASFPLEQVGPPPWRVYVKLAGVEPATILVGGPVQ